MSDPLPGASPPAPGASRSPVLVIVGIVLVAINLRAAITGVGPLLPEIGAELGLASGVAGLLATLPLLAFAFVSPFAARLGERLGMERALFVSLAILAVGLALRLVPQTAALYLGTALAGAGIAIGNVLVPGLVRRDFPGAVALVMGLFTTTMVLVGGFGSALAAPLAEWGDWRLSLGFWLVPAVLAALYFLPLARHRPVAAPRSGTGLGLAGSVWGDPLAWQVTLFMGLQASAFYTLISWLPAILLEEGIAPATTGWLLFFMQLVVFTVTLVVPLLIARLADQSALNATGACLNALGFAGILLAPQWIGLWIVVLGLGCGASLVLSLSMFALRTATPADTTRLSGMAQSFGYLMAMVVPVLLGTLFDLTGAWTLPLMLMIGLGLAQAVMGALAGRDRTLGAAQSGVMNEERSEPAK